MSTHDGSSCGGPEVCAYCARADAHDEPEECPCCGGCFASPPSCSKCGAPLERLTPDGPVQLVRQETMDTAAKVVVRGAIARVLDDELLRQQRRLDEEEL